MGSVPIAAVLLASVQMVSVDRISATGTLLAGVWGEARRLKSKLAGAHEGAVCEFVRTSWEGRLFKRAPGR